mgnify:CR=1 FL=1
MKKILIVEDDRFIQNALGELLRVSGYEVIQAFDGVEGIAEFKKQEIDLILLDIMMPEKDGYDVCKEVRGVSQVPIIILTALDEEEAEVKCFDLKADDYIVKPYSVRVVLKRIEAVLRRTDAGNVQRGASWLEHGNVRLDIASRTAFVSGDEVYLTRTEFDIVKYLLENTGKVCARGELISDDREDDFTTGEREVNFHIMNLRKKGITCIQTVRGIGYKIEK